MERLKDSDWIIGIGSLAMIVGCFCPWYKWPAGTGPVVYNIQVPGTGAGYGWILLALGLAAVVWAGLRAFGVVHDDAIPIADEFLYWGLAGVALVIVVLSFVLKPGKSFSYNSVGVFPGYNIGIFFALFGLLAVALGGFLKLREYPAYQTSGILAGPAYGNSLQPTAPLVQRPVQERGQASTSVQETPVAAPVMTSTPLRDYSPEQTRAKHMTPVQQQVPEAGLEAQQTGKCPHCNEMVAPGATVCMNCGKQLTGQTIDNQPAYSAPVSGYCPHCGDSLVAGGVFCRTCGLRV